MQAKTVSPEISSKARDKVNNALEFLISTNRFYYYIISNVVLQQSLKTKTLEVCFSDTKNKKIMIKYNPNFIVKQEFTDTRTGETLVFEPSDLEISEMFIHEILHICLRHLFGQENYPDRESLAYAQDIIVNDMLYHNSSEYKNRDMMAEKGKNGRIALQELIVSKHCFDSTKNLNIEDYTFGDIYSLIKKELDEQPEKRKGLKDKIESGEMVKDDHGELQFEPGDEKGDQEEQGEGENQGSTESELEAAMKALMSKAVSQNFDRGSLPAGLLKELNLLEKKPDFKDTLNHFVKNCKVDVQQSTWKKPSRRYGAVARGKTSDFRPKILLGIDSSGSVFAHPKALNKIQEYFNFAVDHLESLRAVFCDTQIHLDQEFVKGQPLTGLQGGGGSDMNPIFERALEYEIDGVCFITDGYISPVNLRGLPTVCLIVPGGQIPVGIPANQCVFMTDTD